ncbi:RNA recognition motif-containing protein [Besnoitia besnoiti]|uniref:RNA recognition motif-containing protein n=1 Tax=Besnoitia besnoiti TaxID=94643 RepID=A0A2A9MML1_BESBE|nr:RNA recognition motif-containing protein [Besnoitia besnoiti]PFH37017.1 RNA recognition motif-containing protein [Besnoitia besnoiti]
MTRDSTPQEAASAAEASDRAGANATGLAVEAPAADASSPPAPSSFSLTAPSSSSESSASAASSACGEKRTEAEFGLGVGGEAPTEGGEGSQAGAPMWFLILTEDAIAVLQRQQEAQNAAGATPPQAAEPAGGEEKGQSVVGPVSAETVRIYFQHCLVDGYTQCWRQGMGSWLPLGSVHELKQILQGAEEEEKGEAAACAAAGAAAQSSGRAGCGKRSRIDGIPAEFKYVTPEGVQMVFDRTDKVWRTAEEYEALYALLEEAEAVSPGAAAAAGPGRFSEVGVQQEDMVFPGLREGAEEALAGTLPEEAEKAPELTEAERQKKELNAEKRRLYRQRLKKKKQEGLWVAGRKNPNIYIANLPPDCTEDELADVFKKAGVFKIDPETLRPKIRVYTDETGRCKGDALISFVHENSVEIAIKYFDGAPFRDGACTLKVQLAEFAPKQGQPSASPAAPGGEAEAPRAARGGKRDRKKYLAAKYEQERLLSWGDAIDDGTGRRIVIMKPTYSSEEAEMYEEGDAFYDELRQELFDEIAQFAKPEKVTVIPRHVQGVACVKLKTAEDAERIIEQFRGRFFDGRQLEVFFFDGRTDLKANCLPSRLAKKARVATPDASQSPTPPQPAEAAGQSEEMAVEKEEDQAEGKNEDDEAERLEKFGDWIDQQSSDEEFEVQTEG